MKTLPKIAVATPFCLLLLRLAPAATPFANNTDVLTQSRPVTTSIPLPDPTHIHIVFGKDIQWKNGVAESPLFGDPDKPGIYGVLIKWLPGHYSKPHFHSTDRYIYVVSGTWWVSASSTYDTGKMCPIPAGSLVTDIRGRASAICRALTWSESSRLPAYASSARSTISSPPIRTRSSTFS